MAIRAELSADPQKGAGNGLLHITGLPGGPGPMHFSLCRNQGTTPFLGTDGKWQASEEWHALGEAADESGDMTVPLGTSVIDPVVEQPNTVTYRLTVTVGASKHVTSLRVVRPLFGSGAAAGSDTARLDQQKQEAARRQQEEEERRRLEEEHAARLRAEEEERARRLAQEQEEERRRLAEEEAAKLAATDAAAAAAPRRKRWPLIAAGLVLLLAAAGAGAWYGCAIPGFGPGRCQATLASAPVVAEPPRSCTGLDAAGCYQAGQQALQQRKLEPARQLLQQASALGSIDGSVALARMYDPDTWSAETSPVAQPNWETAVYWYEKAAYQGDMAAKATAGRLLCKYAKDDLERGQGRSYLEQAAAAGNDQARQLLPTCN